MRNDGAVRPTAAASPGRRPFAPWRWVVAFALSSVLIFALPTAQALAGGGANIASAPTVVFGQHTFGTTATGKYECYPAEYWNLLLKAGDQVTVDWAVAQSDYAAAARIYPAGTTDFSINNLNALEYYSIGSNNHAEAVFSTGTGGSFPLIFIAGGCSSSNAGPYDFTVTNQHALVATLKQYAHIRTTTVITATAALADGTSAPDGLAFTLSVSWPGGGAATYTATSAGGALAFPLALPETAKGKKATLTVTRPADAQFLAAKSADLEVPVGRGAPMVVSSCEAASQRARVLARQYRRLRLHAAASSGAQRRRLRRQARGVHRRLRAARIRAAGACGTA